MVPEYNTFSAEGTGTLEADVTGELRAEFLLNPEVLSGMNDI